MSKIDDPTRLRHMWDAEIEAIEIPPSLSNRALKRSLAQLQIAMVSDRPSAIATHQATPHRILPLSYTASNSPSTFTASMAEPATDLPIQRALLNDTQALAKELNISWKQLITLALQDFIRRHRGREHLVEQINAAYVDEPNDEERLHLEKMRSSHRRIIEGEW